MQSGKHAFARAANLKKSVRQMHKNKAQTGRGRLPAYGRGGIKGGKIQNFGNFGGNAVKIVRPRRKLLDCLAKIK